MQTATEGKVREITYWWPRPGSIKPLKKHTFYTKVGDQICGVGYWEGSETVSAQASKKQFSLKHLPHQKSLPPRNLLE